MIKLEDYFTEEYIKIHEALVYGIFIIEGMEKDASESPMLKKMLSLTKVNPLIKIKKVRSRADFKKAIQSFKNSDFKFLHISTHGGTNYLKFENDKIEIPEFVDIIGPVSTDRRIFLSACSFATFNMAKEIIPKYHCLSIIGSPDIVDVDKAAVFWTSFYFLIFKIHESKDVSINQEVFFKVFKKLTSAFEYNLEYFSIIGVGHDESRTSLSYYSYRGDMKKERQRLSTPYFDIFRID